MKKINMNLMRGIHSINIMETVDQSVQCNILGGLNLLGITCWLEKLDIKIPVLVALNFVWVYFMRDSCGKLSVWYMLSDVLQVTDMRDKPENDSDLVENVQGQ